MNTPLIETRHLKKYFETSSGLLHAVDDVNLTIGRGQTLGVVGESGCGKSTFGRVVLRLLEATSGEVLYDGENILKYSRTEMDRMRQKMQIIFQDPYSSLDPRMTVYDLIGEGLLAHKLVSSRTELEERVEAVMKSLEEKNKSIRFILGKKVGKQMRIVPELRFFVDDSLDYIDKIDELLK